MTIRATVFNDAIDGFWSALQVDRVYFIRNPQVKLKPDKFAKSSTASYDLILDLKTEIIQAHSSEMSSLEVHRVENEEEQKRSEVDTRSEVPEMKDESFKELDEMVSISQLNQSMSGRCALKVRVTKKSELKNWSNAKGSGRLFSVQFLDEHGAEIRAAVFNAAVEKFWDVLQVGNLYCVRRPQVKLCDKKYSLRGGAQFELVLNPDTEVNVVEDDGSIKGSNESDVGDEVNFSFVSIDKLPTQQVNERVDVLGVVTQAEPLTTTAKDIPKLVLTIVDRSLRSVEVTLWGETAENCSEQKLEDEVIAFKGCKISDYGGRISLSASKTIVVKPDILEARELKEWWDAEAHTAEILATPSFDDAMKGNYPKVSISELKECAKQLNGSQTASYQFAGSITKWDLSGALWYSACVNSKCKKKVSKAEDGLWFCSKCQKHSRERMLAYVLTCQISDSSSSVWVTAFDQVGQELLGGIGASELDQWRENGEDETVEKVFEERMYKNLQFTVRCKFDPRMSEVTFTVLQVSERV
eukprot:TRINITY_DN506_c0_g1_i3.p1 TRINITY_DN506_c0_g1~~TRINITY_DN506_c0_g1_i3.p1  ORF type:complete len:588 (-),score=167.21 TRINITY_DN506_c0_g1_i3:808-2388(-)